MLRDALRRPSAGCQRHFATRCRRFVALLLPLLSRASAAACRRYAAASICRYERHVTMPDYAFSRYAAAFSRLPFLFFSFSPFMFLRFEPSAEINSRH
jgi:hypothetical protein